MLGIRTRTYRSLFLLPALLLWGMLFVARADGQDATAGLADPPPIAITPKDGFNLLIQDQLAPDRLVVGLTHSVHNWFAGTFTNLPVGRPVTIGLADTDPLADITRWQGLAPLMTYADPLDYACYTWYSKDAQGRWVSGDPFLSGAARYAGSGALPEQQLMPAALAAKFLSADGRFWFPWREVDGTQVATALKVFRITQTFAAPTASVVMRVPFTYTYLQQYLSRLTAGHYAGVTVDEIGHSQGQRKLQIVRFEDPAGRPPSAAHRTLLLMAREHATEQDASWVMTGAIRALLAPSARQLRDDTTWLVLPIDDPDGVAQAIFDHLTEMYTRTSGDTYAEEIAYARYLTDYTYSGRTVDVAVTLHNVEANESENIACPMIKQEDAPLVEDFNQQYFDALTRQGFFTANARQPWMFGSSPGRLFGWCGERFGTLGIPFEVNSRYPKHRLTVPENEQLGATLVDTLASWVHSPPGERLHTHVSKLLRFNSLARAAYFSWHGYDQGKRTDWDMLANGF